MNAIMEAARLQGTATVNRKAWSTRGSTKYHIWELSTGGCIMLKHEKGRGFAMPVMLEQPLDALVERFRNRIGNRVFAPGAA
ncbi:MAG: hypothetical protein KAI85_03425 [Halopseudomonas aestusnigri]|nr:hypothetical protein [Halopseudomonas aestusnigri]